MARRAPVFAPASGTANLFANPYNVSPSASLDALSEQYQAQYNKPSFASEHPVLTGLAGLAIAGPGGAFALPSALKQKDQARKAALLAGYNQTVQNTLANQKAVDEYNMPRNQTQLTDQILQRINPNFPSLAAREVPSMGDDIGPPAPVTNNTPVYSREFLENILKGAGAGSDSKYQQAASLNALRSSAQLTSGASSASSSGVGDDGVIRANANALNTGDTVEPPVYIANPVETLGNISQSIQTGAREGTDRYKFDQEAPKRAAEVIKLLQEGDVQAATALLRRQEVQTEKGKLGVQQADIRQKNASASYDLRRYAGGPNQPQPTVASELKALYNAGAYGRPGTPEAQTAYGMALIRGGGGNSESESVTYGDDGKVKSRTVSSRGRGGSSPRSGGATLSSGRKYNP